MSRLDERLRRIAPPRIGPFREGAFRSALHEDTRIAAILGIALGVAFAVCFLTGMISHLIQRPVSWFSWPSRPAWLYGVTQGIHVAAGLAAIPLLLAKLWVVAPRFWSWPPFRHAGHAVERAGLLPLVGGSLFLLFTGIGSINRLKPWGFSFPAAHYSAAWIAIGALVMHVGAKLHVAARALVRGADGPDRALGRALASAIAAGTPETRETPALAGSTVSRRGFLAGAFAGTIAVTIATVGQTLRPLRRASVLAPRDPAVGPQGVPVNRTARSAGVTEAAVDPGYRLVVDGDVGAPLSLSLEELRAMPQRAADLPITCVDGWSASGSWRGIRVSDLLERAGAREGATAEVVSLQAPGTAYASSLLDPGYVADPESLLALELNGETLDLDHGYPARLIAPNRPGVMQTKWVTRIVVHS